ncbi:hypothetical protein [Ekhidna sp. To15]|uniref:hypothetical protein n=1 Tax=Ekhidna sp. To15 TaxID=3395267 RepID=UPI003F51D0EE
MKRIITAILLLSFGLTCFAQTGAFKKLLSDRSNMDKEVFYDQLLQFQKSNVEFSNVYYQIAKVEQDIFASLDPIVDRIASRQRIYNAKTSFGLAKNYLDPKEVSRFPEWYDVPDTVAKDSVSIIGVRKIEKSHENSENYAVYYEELIENYDNAVYHYLKAREGFIAINTSADNLRQLFLKADDSLKTAVSAVGVSFDSSMYYIDIYRDIYQKLPYKKKRKVNINRRKIDHFRMNGITPANFLADDIDVWDYKQWSDRFLNLLKVEVDGLQDEIKNAYNFFVSTNDKMINGDECIQAQLDDLKFQRIINLITKYDNESVLIDIFQYLISKLDYGNKYVYEKNCNVLDVPPTDDYLSRKARIYQNMFTSFQKADSLDEAITTSGHRQETFQWFFDELMPGENGSQTFAEEQEAENYSSFKMELTGLMNKLGEQRFRTDTLSECFSADSVFLIPGALEEGNFCAKRKLWLSDSLELFLGIQDDKNQLIGAMPSGEDYQKLWEIAPYKNSEISYFKIVGDSTYLIGGQSSKGWLSQISSSGVEYFTAILKSTDPIKNVVVNQLQGIATVIQGSNKSYTISKVNFNGKVVSTSKFELPGEYVGMFRQEQALWFFSHNITTDGSKITASVYDEGQAVMTGEYIYTFKTILKNPSIIKNDNEYLTLLSVNSFSDDEIVYALMNYEGKIEHETIF